MATKGFTKIDNCILLNTDLSLEAKGLYAILKYLSGIPNFLIRRDYIKAISGYGETAFRRVWKELKTKGLLIETRLRNKGKYEYKYTLNTNELENAKKSKISAKGNKTRHVDSDGNKPLQGQMDIDDVIKEEPVINQDVKLISESTGFTNEQSKEILAEANNNVSKVLESYKYVKEKNNVKNAFNYTKWIVNNLAKRVNAFSNKKSLFNNFEQRNYNFNKLEKALLYGESYELPA